MGDKGKGLLSYLLGWLGGLIVLLAMKNNTKRDVMNAAQGIVLSAGYAVLSFVISFVGYFISFVPYISLILGVLYFVALILAIVNVLTDKDPKLPVIGDIAESLFAKQLAAAPEFVNKAPAGANFDPNTGQPINKGPVEANFDPNTGQPINKGPVEANFDPNTGQPINKGPVEANFDPNTGQPINKEPVQGNPEEPQQGSSEGTEQK